MVSSFRRIGCIVPVVVLLALTVFPVVLFAQQSPWERAALNLEATFTGRIAPNVVAWVEEDVTNWIELRTRSVAS